MKRISLAPDDV